MSGVSIVGTQAGSALAGTYFGAQQSAALAQLAATKAQFPALAPALDAIADSIRASMAEQTSAQTSIGAPKFANGVTDFKGGLAFVHRDQALVNLPAHTNVIPRAQTHRMFDMREAVRPLEDQMRELNARVDLLAPRIGDALARPMQEYGKAHGDQLGRVFRRQGG